MRARRTLLVAFALALATAAAFRPLLDAGFTTTDDPAYVCQNPRVLAGLTAEGTAWAFTTMAAANYHPVTWLSHMADVTAFGPGPRGHHGTNILLHAANALLLFLALRSLTGATWRSAFVAALFAVHPMHVESVAWIAERKDLLCGFFTLLAIRAYAGYARKPGAGRYALLLLAAALALLSKPMAVTLPFLLLLLDFWPLDRVGRPGKAQSASLPRLVAEKIPLILLSAAFCAVTVVAQRRGGGLVLSTGDVMLPQRLASTAVAYVTYGWKLLWPADLSMFYPKPAIPFQWPVVAGATGLLALATALALACRRRFPWLPVGWLWFLGMLVPVIGLVPVGEQFIADRYTYLPAIGLFIVAAWGIPALLPDRPGVRRALAAAALLVLALLGSAARTQAGYWIDSETLYRHAIAATRDNWFAENNLGMVLSRSGRVSDAAAHFEKSLARHPFQASARNNYGAVLAQLGKTDEALEQVRLALVIQPGYAEACNNLGNIRSLRGEHDEAVRSYLEAIRLRPDYPDPYNNLGAEYLSAGRTSEANAMFREYLSRRAVQGGGGRSPGASGS